jgi:hypothetical protein
MAKLNEHISNQNHDERTQCIENMNRLPYLKGRGRQMGKKRVREKDCDTRKAVRLSDVTRKKRRSCDTMRRKDNEAFDKKIT